jgi:hypothetical protein
MRRHAPICEEGCWVLPPDDTNRVFPLPGGAYAAWITQARLLPAFTCDAVFRIEPNVYIGPDDGMTSLEWETANVSLPPLDLPRQFADRVTTAELLGREDALISHYRRIVEVTDRHGKTASLRPFPYFRTEPAIIGGDEVLTEFAWNDDVHETQTVLEMLAESGGGPPRLLDDNQDQGWRILIVTTGAVTCFIEWDAEGPPPAVGGYAVDAVALAGQAGAALARLRIIHDRLVLALGRDYWTYRRPPPPANRVRSAISRLFGINARSRSG